MKGNSEELAFEHHVREAIKRNVGPLADSSVFLAILSDDYERDALAVLQLGLAVLMDKPIYLLVPKGTELKANVKRLAIDIEYFDREKPGSVEAATERLLSKLPFRHG